VLSRKVAHSLVNDLQARYSGAKVVIRDVAENPPPHAGRAFVNALQTQPDQLTKEQSEALALSESLISELSAVDLLVLAVPMG
jgi:FMN-dependent NADH-azoreductase